jgi:hypothetical protein
MANNVVRDSILFGGDGIRGNADDWGADSVRVWKVTVCPLGYGDDTNAVGTLAAARDSAALYPTSYNFILVQTKGSCRDTTFDATVLKQTYFAGQTARNEEGATYWGGAGWEFEDLGGDRSSDIVMRYIRGRGLFNNGIAVWAAERMVVDQVSASWAAASGGQHILGVGGDSTTMGLAAFIDQFTYSNTLSFEPRIDHPGIFGFFASPRDEPAMRRSSMFRNTILGRGHRCPNATGGDTLIISQTIVYNCFDRQTQLGNQTILDLVGLFNHVGPGTSTGVGRERPVYVLDSCSYSGNISLSSTGDSTCVLRHYISKVSFIWPSAGDTLWQVSGTSPLYKGADSLVVCRDITDSPIGYFDPPWNCVTHGDTVSTAMVSAPITTPANLGIPDYMYPDTSGYADTSAVIAQVATAGAYRRLRCDGTWAPARDTVDRDMAGRFLNDLRNLTPVGMAGNRIDNVGLDGSFTSTSIGNAMGVDTVTVNRTLASATQRYVGPDSTKTLAACTDADGDGMPAAFEALHAGLQDSDATDRASDDDFDGYLAIEEYLNGTNPNVFTSADDGNELGVPPGTYNDTIRLVTSPLSDVIHPVLGTYKGWNTDSVPPAGEHSGHYCIAPDTTRIILVTTDTIIPGAEPLTAAQADSILIDWNQPGCDTASVKTRAIP